MKLIRYLQSQLEEADSHVLLNGNACVYSVPAPDKDGVNEDAAAILNVEPDSVVIIVADGVGGQQAGDEASRIAIESIASSVQQSQVNQSLRDSILDGIEQANKKILAMGRGAATTVVVAEICQNQLRTYYVGDSMILLTGQRGKLKFQNVAHSPVGYALESGLINEEEAINHEERNIVSNVLGSTEMSIEIGPVLEMAPCDTLILSSDSVPDNLYTEEIIDIVRAGALKNTASQLVDVVATRMRYPEAEHPSHSDDFTFVLYRSTHR